MLSPVHFQCFYWKLYLIIQIQINEKYYKINDWLWCSAQKEKKNRMERNEMKQTLLISTIFKLISGVEHWALSSVCSTTTWWIFIIHFMSLTYVYRVVLSSFDSLCACYRSLNRISRFSPRRVSKPISHRQIHIVGLLS